MGFDGAFLHAERFRDVGVGVSLGEQGQDVSFARGEGGDPVLGPGGLRAVGMVVAVDEAAGGGGVEHGGACGDEVDGAQDLGGVGVLEEEAVRACGQRVVDVLVEVEGGQGDDLRRVGQGAQALGGGDAVHAGHADVDQGDVDAVGGGLLDGVEPVRGLGDVLDGVVAVEEVGQAEADEGVVVDGHGADHVRGPFCSVTGWGMRAASLQVPAPPGPAFRCPPSASTRSRRPMRPNPEATAWAPCRLVLGGLVTSIRVAGGP